MGKISEDYWHPIEERGCEPQKFKPPGQAKGYIFGDAGRPYPSLAQALDNTDVPVIRLPDGRRFRTRELLAKITASEYWILERDRGNKRCGQWRKKPGAMAKYSMSALLDEDQD